MLFRIYCWDSQTLRLGLEVIASVYHSAQPQPIQCPYAFPLQSAVETPSCAEDIPTAAASSRGRRIGHRIPQWGAYPQNNRPCKQAIRPAYVKRSGLRFIPCDKSELMPRSYASWTYISEETRIGRTRKYGDSNFWLTQDSLATFKQHLGGGDGSCPCAVTCRQT